MPGTPKTLRQAIQNGLVEQANTPWAITDDQCVERHVLDFLRQHFGGAYLEMDNDTSEQVRIRGLECLRQLAKRIGVER